MYVVRRMRETHIPQNDQRLVIRVSRGIILQKIIKKENTASYRHIHCRISLNLYIHEKQLIFCINYFVLSNREEIINRKTGNLLLLTFVFWISILDKQSDDMSLTFVCSSVHFGESDSIERGYFFQIIVNWLIKNIVKNIPPAIVSIWHSKCFSTHLTYSCFYLCNKTNAPLDVSLYLPPKHVSY